jgi:hypothetical protein
MNFTSMLTRWIPAFATTACLLAACGGAPVGDPTGQSSEAVSESKEPSLFGHCNVVWIGRTPIYQTGYCVLDKGTKDKPVCELVESPQCTPGLKDEPLGCACGLEPPDCTLVDDVPCGPVSN